MKKGLLMQEFQDLQTLVQTRMDLIGSLRMMWKSKCSGRLNENLALALSDIVSGQEKANPRDAIAA